MFLEQISTERQSAKDREDLGVNPKLPLCCTFSLGRIGVVANKIPTKFIV